MEILDCKRCGEDAFSLMVTGFGWFVRVRRISRCKNYLPVRRRNSCKTELYVTEQEAVNEWNRSQAEGISQQEGKDQTFKKEASNK